MGGGGGEGGGESHAIASPQLVIAGEGHWDMMAVSGSRHDQSITQGWGISEHWGGGGGGAGRGAGPGVP